MDLRRLRYFVAVAEELHFGKAARRLNISQPPLSQQIRRLETDLNAILFVRNRRKVELTEAGSFLLRRAAILLNDADQIAAQVRMIDRGRHGMLDIGYSPPADLIILPTLVSRFEKSCPDIRLNLVNANSALMLNWLAVGRLHGAIVRLPIFQDNLRVIPIMREKLVAVLPEGHSAARKKRLSLRDFAAEPLIGFPRDLAPAYFDLICSVCKEKGGFIFSPSHTVESIQTALALVAGGIGVSLQPESVHVLNRTGVVIRRIADSPACAEMGLALRDEQHSPAMEMFLKTIRSMAADGQK